MCEEAEEGDSTPGADAGWAAGEIFGLGIGVKYYVTVVYSGGMGRIR